MTDNAKLVERLRDGNVPVSRALNLEAASALEAQGRGEPVTGEVRRGKVAEYQRGFADGHLEGVREARVHYAATPPEVVREK